MQNHPPNHLILLANSFPYGVGETFLESETPFLTKAYDKVIVITKTKATGNARHTADNLFSYKVNPVSDLTEKLRSVVLFILHFRKAIRYINEELQYLRTRNKKITPFILEKLFHDLLKALTLSSKINKVIHEHKLSGNILLYAYWLTSSALATTFVIPKKNDNIKRIARAHHMDLYEELHVGQYLSFRQVLAKELSMIFPISHHGLNHLKNSVPPDFHSKIVLSRLGTSTRNTMPAKAKDKNFLIVSCSFLSEIKRVNYIIGALNMLQNRACNWVHFGDGPLRQDMETLAWTKLRHMDYRFMGFVENETILKFYEENFVDLFINTSSSEGLPVSIMEAQSFGIPVIALDVGGVSEIVTESCGRLLAASSTSREVAKAIEAIYNLPQAEYDNLRKNSYKNWKHNYCAEKNYVDFCDRISKLFKRGIYNAHG